MEHGRLEDLPPEVQAQVAEARRNYGVVERVEATINAAGVPVEDLRIAMGGGHVVLTGRAPSAEARLRAGEITLADPAVGDVTNHIVVADPGDPWTDFTAATERGDLRAAEALASDLTRSGDPDTRVRALYALGSVRREAGDVEGALEACKAALESRHPEWSYWAKLLFGRIVADLGQVDMAVESMEELIGLGHPEASVHAVKDVAALLSKVGQPDRAEAILRRAIGHDSTVIAVAGVATLTMQLTRRHGKEQALRTLSGMAGAERPGSHRRGVYDVGVATFLVRLGDRDSARQAAQAGAANEHPEVRQVAERLLALTRLG